MINQMNPINQMCDKCLQEFATNSDTVKYKCGHIFHRNCLLPQKMSILNPRCKKCENGMIDGYPTSEEEDEEEEEDDDDEDHDDEDHDDEEEDLTKIETIVVVQIYVLVVSLIGLLIGLV
jgi:hypothetical protein